MTKRIKKGFHKQWNWSDFTPERQPGLFYSRRFIAMLLYGANDNERKFYKGHIAMCVDKGHTQLAFYVNLHRSVIGPSATLTGRHRPDIDLRRMLTGHKII